MMAKRRTIEIVCFRNIALKKEGQKWAKDEENIMGAENGLSARFLGGFLLLLYKSNLLKFYIFNLFGSKHSFSDFGAK